MAPWNISTASLSQTFQLPIEQNQQDLFIRADGLKMYVLISGTNSLLREYNLSTAWNITTASFVQSIFFSGEDGGIFFKPDGTKMFRVSLTQHRVFQYSLSTPWNISTATLDLGSRNISEDNLPSDIFFRPDGLKMYVEGWENSKVYEYTLSVPWSVTSAVSTGFKDISAQDLITVGLWFEPTTGKKMYVVGNDDPPAVTGNRIHEYNLSTPWSVSTAVFFQTLLVNAQDTQPAGVIFRDNGLQMFIVGDVTDKVYAYTLPPTPPKNFTVKALLVPDIWKFREHKTSIGVFDPVYTFQRESGAPNRFQMIGGSGTALGNGYLFKSFPIADIIGSDIKVIWTDISSSFGDVRISVYDGAYDPNSQADFPDAVSFPTDITPKGGGLLGSISDVETGITVFPVTTTLLALNINYANSVTGFVTVFIINSDSQQVPFSNLLFSSIEITKLAKYNFNNAQVTNVLTGTVRDWGVVSAGSIQSFVFGSCSDISTSAGWTIVNGGGQILIDDPSAPDLIKLNNLTSGSGGRYAWMDIGTTISGDVKLEFKLDYTSNSGVSPELSIGFVNSIVHPQFPLTNHVIRVDILASIERFGVLNGFVNGAGGSRTTTSGAKNQHAVWVYPNSNSPVSDSSLKGPYYVTVELKSNKLRLSVYKDQAKTQHMRGSPREVDATGVIPQNLRYIIVANSIFATGRVFNGTVDDVCISQNANSLPIIPLKVSPATGTFTEDWEGYFTGDQNPTPWISKTEINDGFDLLTVLPTTNILNFGTAGDLRGIDMSPDGTKFYAVGERTTKLLKQWTLTTPYDLSTAIFVQSITITGGAFPQTGGLFFKPDGTKFFITFSDDDQVHQWTLTTPFDISTAIQGVPKCVRTPPNPCNGDGSQGTQSVSFSPDGINMYIGNFVLPTNQLTQWVLSTPWDVTTAVLVRVLVGQLPAGTSPRSQFFKPDGTKMFLMSGSASIIITTSRIDEYVLSTPWDISTAIWNQKSFDPGLGNFATAITFSLDGLKMYTSNTSSVFEYNLAPSGVIPITDIHEVSTSNPINGLKAFKIDQKYHRDSGFPWGRVSVSRFVPAIVTTNGSGLDMPISLNASMRTSILSSFSSPVGVMVGYEFISGAPIGSILGLPFIETSARGILFQLYGTAVGSKAYMWNGTEWISNSTLDIPISQSNTVGTVAGINQQNLKDILNNSATLSNIYGIDFESHVTGMWIGYVGLNRSTLSVDTEVLINADNTLLQNAGIKIRQFFIDAILPTRKIDFFIDAIISPTKFQTFTIDALVPPIPKTFTVKAIIVNRFASNSCYMDAILAGTSVINSKTFLIDANLSKIKDFTIDVILVKIRKIDSFIDAQLRSLANIKIFTIDAIIGALTEPQFILDVESTIGFKGVGHGV